MRWAVLMLVVGLASCSTEAPGFRFRVAYVLGKLDVTPCEAAPGFRTYLARMNKFLKNKNRECVHTGDPSSTSHSIECRVVNGQVEAIMVWEETKAGCEAARKFVTGESS